MMSMARFKLFLITLISTIPIIAFQGRFEFPKVFLFLCLGVGLIIYFLLNPNLIFVTKKDKWYFAWLFVLSLNNPNLLGGSYRNQGIIFFITLWFLIKFVESLELISKQLLHKFLATTIIVESLIVLFGYKLGTIGDTNAVSGFISIGLLLVINYLPKWLLTLPMLAMIIDFSKAGFLSLLPYIIKKSNLIYITLLIIVVFIIKPISFGSRFENRKVIWQHAINLIKEKPLLGYGAESTELLFDKAFYQSGFPLSGLIIDRAHNLFLDITIWSGLVGLFLFCGFLLEMYKEVSGDGKKILLSFLIFSFFQPLSVVHWILFAVII